MAGLVPFNRRVPLTSNAGFDDFYNMLDDFFGDRWQPSRNLQRDTFKLDVKELEKEYQVEVDLPGVKKEEIELKTTEKVLSISVNREESTEEENKYYIHRERRTSSMSRSIRLAEANLNDIKAKLEEGVLTITVPKLEKTGVARIVAIE